MASKFVEVVMTCSPQPSKEIIIKAFREMNEPGVNSSLIKSNVFVIEFVCVYEVSSRLLTAFLCQGLM